MPENGQSRRAVKGFGPQTKVREVVDALGEKGTELLKKHGYDLGEGFVDVKRETEAATGFERDESVEGGADDAGRVNRVVRLETVAA